jgi:predicted transcriptional regulator
MTIWDDRILEILRSEGPNSPTPISEHQYIHVEKSTVSRRLSRLADYGLVETYPNGVYGISPEGTSYLDGELDASEIDEPADEHDDSNAHATS